MAKIFCTTNQKGGVGKTTTAINLSAFAALGGLRTLLIDCDPQGNATSGIGIDKSGVKSTIYEVIIENADPKSAVTESGIKDLHLMASNANLAASEIELIDRAEREFILQRAIQKIRDEYDLIVIDCPPSLGLLTINALVASERLVIPLQCEYYALEGLGQLLNTFNMVKENLNPDLEIGGVILTMADFRTNLTQQVIEEVRKYFGEKTFKNVIPRSVRISEAPSFGKPIITYAPNSKGAKAYQAVGQEFIDRFELKRETSNGSEKKESAEIAVPKESVAEEKASQAVL